MTALYDIPLTTIEHAPTSLGAFAGKVLLVVNVASRCGLTPQYEGLQALYARYRDQGFEVLGFPANDFRGQEPGTEAEIRDFCATEYAVEFPMFAKVTVLGEGKHPLYRELTRQLPSAAGAPGSDFRQRLKGFGIEPAPEPEVLWNFEKFLIGRDGKVAARFAPDVGPQDPILVQAVEAELAR